MTDATTVEGLGLLGASPEVLAREQQEARDRARDEEPARREREIFTAWKAANPGLSEGEYDQVRDRLLKDDQIARAKAQDATARAGNARLVREAF